jgi:hypothetical protein
MILNNETIIGQIQTIQNSNSNNNNTMTLINTQSPWNNIDTTLSKINMRKQLIEHNLSIYQWSRMPVNDIRNYIRNKVKESTPIVEAPIVEAPIVEAPIVETPIVEAQIETTHVAMNLIKAPVVEAPIVEAPIVEAPIVEAPIVEAQIETTHVAMNLIKAPIVEAPVVEAPVVEAPIVEAPVVEAPVVEEPIDYVNTISGNDHTNDPNELRKAFVNNIQDMFGFEINIRFPDEIRCGSNDDKPLKIGCECPTPILRIRDRNESLILKAKLFEAEYHRFRFRELTKANKTKTKYDWILNNNHRHVRIIPEWVVENWKWASIDKRSEIFNIIWNNVYMINVDHEHNDDIITSELISEKHNIANLLKNITIGEFEDDIKDINHLIKNPELEPEDVVLSRLWLILDSSWAGSKQLRFLKKHMKRRITNWVKIGSTRRNNQLISWKANATIIIEEYEKSLDNTQL